MSTPTISVVMAVRNGASRLQEAIASVRAQTVPIHEILVVDGNSSDDTVAIARRAPGVRVIDQIGATLADAYNTGVRETTGSHVAYLSYDDAWTPRKLELQLALLADPAVDAVAGLAQFVVEADDAPPPGFRRELLDAPVKARIMETLLTPRWVYEQVGGHRPEVSPADDTDWFARADDAGIRFGIVDDVILIKRVHGASSAHTSPLAEAGLMSTVRAAIERKRRAATSE